MVCFKAEPAPYGLRLLFFSNARKNLLFRKTHFGGAGIFILGKSIPDRGKAPARQPLLAQAKNFVILRAIESFHRTRIDAEQRGTRQKIAQGDVSLVAGPGVARLDRK